MAELNPNLIALGIAIEGTRGTPETLDSTDYDVALLDVEQLQNAPDKAKAGKQATGTLLNPAKSYTRTRGATAPVKMEVRATATPTIEPNYFKVLALAGMKTGVIDAGTNDNVEAYYDGLPTCATATIATPIWGCDANGYVKGVKGAVIADGKFTIEGSGAPLIFTGTISGAFYQTALTASTITPTEDAGDCILGTGMTATLGGVLVNFTKMEASLNLSAAMVSDFSDAQLTNISHYDLSDGGEPTSTFSAIKLTTDADDDWAELFGDVVNNELVFENGDAKFIINLPQSNDIQESNETGVMVRDFTVDNQDIRLQLK